MRQTDIFLKYRAMTNILVPNLSSGERREETDALKTCE